MKGRAMAVLALAIPVLAGLAYLWTFDAPSSYLAVNGGSLVLAAVWIALAPPQGGTVVRRVLLMCTLVLLFVPLLTGPAIDGVARWLPLGPVTLHAGMLMVPLLVVLLGKEPEYAPALLSVALLAAFLQPDMATGAALMLAAFGLYDATKDWRYGAFAAVAFVISLVAAIQGELPPQPFVERVIFLLARTDPVGALGLLVALVASFFLMASAVPGPDASRKALAGSLFGFCFAGIVSNYPSALIGYGAAPILGYGLALGYLCAKNRDGPAFSR
ncbi:hypothetical protein [Qipengyuania sp.]|uniref:hypothetical protein n=1 Tax=Qipengyuania sp. TaxID=2004515 RepID=UPI0035C85EA0